MSTPFPSELPDDVPAPGPLSNRPGEVFTPGASITLHLRGTVIGPDDKVIINMPEAHSEWAQELIRVANDTLGPDRVLVICGDGVQVSGVAPEPPRTEAVCACQAANNGILEPPAEGCPIHGARP